MDYLNGKATHTRVCRPHLNAIVCAVNKFLFNFGLIFLMCNFNLFASRVSGKFIFFSLCAVDFVLGLWTRERMYALACVCATTKLLKFLHKWFFDKVLLQHSAIELYGDSGSDIQCQHNRLREPAVYVYSMYRVYTHPQATHAVPPRSDFDWRWAQHSTCTAHIVQFRKLLRLYRYEWNCFFFFLLLIRCKRFSDLTHCAPASASVGLCVFFCRCEACDMCQSNFVRFHEFAAHKTTLIHFTCTCLFGMEIT